MKGLCFGKQNYLLIAGVIILAPAQNYFYEKSITEKYNYRTQT